jgi:hypothetical protein
MIDLPDPIDITGTQPTVRPWEDLRTAGILWLINAAVFHPRGFALGLVRHERELVGWRLLGDGSEPWVFADSAVEAFAAVEAFLNEHRPIPRLIQPELTHAEAEEIKQRFLAAQQTPRAAPDVSWIQMETPRRSWWPQIVFAAVVAVAAITAWSWAW